MKNEIHLGTKTFHYQRRKCITLHNCLCILTYPD